MTRWASARSVIGSAASETWSVRSQSKAYALPVVAGLLALLISACSGSADSSSTTDVSKEQYGVEWPLTISEGMLICERNEVSIQVRRDRYSLNGAAAQNGEWLDPTPIRERKPDGALKSLEPLIQDGLELCADR